MTAYIRDYYTDRRCGDGRISDLVNVAQDDFLDLVVLQDLPNDATITASDDQDFFRIRVTREREMCDHFLIPISYA